MYQISLTCHSPIIKESREEDQRVGRKLLDKKKSERWVVSTIVKVGCLRKSQLGFGFGRLILPKTETQWVFRNLVFCKEEHIGEVRSKI